MREIHLRAYPRRNMKDWGGFGGEARQRWSALSRRQKGRMADHDSCCATVAGDGLLLGDGEAGEARDLMASRRGGRAAGGVRARQRRGRCLGQLRDRCSRAIWREPGS